MRWRRQVLFGLFVVTCLACGGTGGTFNQSSFEGSWAGTWTSNINEDGTITMVVADIGTVDGTLHINQTNEDADLSGFVEENGDYTGTYQFSGNSPVHITGHFSINGDTMTGSFHENGGPSADFTMDRL